VPGCENGDAPYSQELLGGGKVNRSFLVRTRRGRFVVRLNENAIRSGLDREREIALHTAAAGAGIAPTSSMPARPVLPDHRLRRGPAVDASLLHAHARPALARQRLRSLHALRRRRCALRSHGGRAPLRGPSSSEPARSGALAHCWSAATRRCALGSKQRAACIVHSDLHHGNVLTADRIYFIDWEYAQVGDPLLDLACVHGVLPARRRTARCCSSAAGLDDAASTPAMLASSRESSIC
jgi:aminoglycoside phosphotransferase (APT) family kinase protein